MKTEAAILVSTTKPLEIVDIEIPKLKQGQVLIELYFSGICGTQLMEIDGKKGKDIWLPHCLGHEGIGKVVEKHSSVSKVKIDDTVVLSWIKGPGIEAGGTKYKWGQSNVNAGSITTFQKFAVISENRVTKYTTKKSSHLDVLLGCAAPTGMGAVKKVLNATSGQSLIVFGIGGIGLCSILMAKELGLDPIVAIDKSEARLELAKKCGATATYNSNKHGHENLVDKFCDTGFDFAVEATGNISVMENILEHVKNKTGRSVIVGNAPHNTKFSINPNELNAGKSIMGTWGGNSCPDEDLQTYAEILHKNDLNLSELSTTQFSLKDANLAIDSMRGLKETRSIIDMSLA